MIATENRRHDPQFLALEELHASTSRAKAFLSWEFATWWWYVIDTGSYLPPKVEQAWLDDLLILKSTGTNPTDCQFRGGDPADFDAVRAALAAGSRVASMRLGWRTGDFEALTAVVDAADSGVRSVQVSLHSNDQTPRGALQLLAAQTVLGLRAAYRREFLRRRLSQQWHDQELEAITLWMRPPSAETQPFALSPQPKPGTLPESGSIV